MCLYVMTLVANEDGKLRVVKKWRRRVFLWVVSMSITCRLGGFTCNSQQLVELPLATRTAKESGGD